MFNNISTNIGKGNAVVQAFSTGRGKERHMDGSFADACGIIDMALGNSLIYASISLIGQREIN